MWQTIYEQHKDKNFIIIAVAMDSRNGAADPWIKEASPTFVSLIDKEHRLADLYNMVNVPQAVWIDEQGIIVRPTENAGAYEAFRSMDLTTGTMPEDEMAKAKQARSAYYSALDDWILNGVESKFALGGDDARNHVPTMSEDTALAHTHFRLGQHLLKTDNADEADIHLQEAIRLHPDSWNMWRQWCEPTDSGIAAGPEFWKRVQALGENKYYPLPDIVGMPE